MPPLMQLPSYQYPVNGGIDFKPLGDAIDSYGQNALARRKLDQGDTHLDLERQKVAMSGAQHAQALQQAKMDQFGRMSQAISETKDPAMREQLVGMAQTKFPDLISHAVGKGADPNHPEFWPAMRWHSQNYDPVGEKVKLAQIHSAYRKDEPEMVRTLRAAGIDPRSARGQELIAQSIKGNSPIDQVIVDAIKGPSGPTPTPQSPVRPQSFNDPQQGGTPLQPIADTPSPPQPSNALARGAGQTPQAPGPSPNALAPGGNDDPMLIPAQMAQGPPPTAAPPAPPALVDTPLGPMPAAKAKLLGFGLAYQGKGEAGKMMIANAEALGKDAIHKNDEKELKAYESLGNIRRIRSSYDPDFLNYKTQGKMAWSSILSKAGALPKAEQAKLYKFATFRRDVAANTNGVIKDNSGATVTQQELDRNMVEVPNAGSGLFDGDDPVTFEAKVDRVEETVSLGIARTRYLRDKGFKGDINAIAAAMPIEQMRDRINQRAKEIETTVRKEQPNQAKNIIDREVDMRVKKEFGI